ncbi:Chelated iron transport system membrane protein YfeB [Nymphon striatum]|nr:Chelated iron transport system membrane protein YfeB [Nymphon striatum]
MSNHENITSVETRGYSFPMRAIHWLMAAMIFYVIFVGILMGNDVKVGKHYDYHRAAGFLLLLLVLLRIVISKLSKPPLPKHVGEAGLQQLAARIVHSLLYIGLIIQPLLGWYATNTWGVAKIPFFFGMTLPRIAEKNRELGNQLLEYHGCALADDKFKVVTTFTVIADMARNVAGDAAIVESITKPGAEIHGYQPTPRDIIRAQGADLILWNGMNLELWFEQFFRNLKDVPGITLSDRVEPMGIAEDNIRDGLVKYDPENAEIYKTNAETYKAEITAAVAPLKEKILTIPAEDRWLVSSEGAFSYLARDFEMKELYLWPINADQQGTPQQVRKESPPYSKQSWALFPLARGSVSVFGQSVEHALKNNMIAYVPQAEEVDWSFPVLVEDVVMMGRYGHMNFMRIAGSKDKQAVSNALERVGMSDFRTRQIGELSGGQKKRVFLARALAQESKVILLDEPFTGVDVKTEEAIIELLRTMREEGHVMLVSTHNLGSVPENNLERTFGGVLRHFVLGGTDLHDDEDARQVTVITDDERPFVIYDEKEKSE